MRLTKRAALRSAAASIGLLATTLGGFAQSDNQQYLAEKLPRIHVIAFANSDYQDLTDIPSVKHDYKLIRDAFSGENVVLHGDDNTGSFATDDELWQKLRAYLAEIEPGDIVFFYYSGHGFSFKGANYLVPLNYPKTIVNGQSLFRLATPVHQIVNALQRYNPSAAVVMLDSCRTGLDFEIDDNGKQIPAGHTFEAIPTAKRDRKLPFPVKRLFPNEVGGEAIGLSTDTRGSFYTEAFHELAKQPVRMLEFDGALRDRTIESTLSLSQPLEPEIGGDPFGFSPQPAEDDWKRLKDEWTAVLDKKSTDAVYSFLRRFPYSQFLASAHKYISDQPLPDGGGSQIALAANIDLAFEAGRDDMMVGMINSAFPVRFTRVMSQDAVVNFESAFEAPAQGIVVGKDSAELIANAEAQIKQVGTKLEFDAAQFQKYAELSSAFDIDLLSDDRSGAAVVGTLPKGLPIQIAAYRFDDATGDLFAKVELPHQQFDLPAPIGQLGNEAVWAKFSAAVADPKPKTYTNILGIARSEVVVDWENLDHSEVTAVIEQEIDRLKAAGLKVNWVSIATPRVESPQIAELTAALNDEADSEKRHELRHRLDEQDALLTAQTDERLIRALHARYTLVRKGVDSKAITIVNGRDGVAADTTRLRFFTNK